MKTSYLDCFDRPMRLENGVMRFVEWDVWPPSAIDGFRRDGFVAQRGRAGMREAPCPQMEMLLAELAAVEGVILELATGPDGGNLPPLLARNPRATVIANDISAGLLQLWQEFLSSEGLGANVCCAAFDAREMPLHDNSIDAVSGVIAFGIDRGHQAVQEALRVLRPGGLLVAREMHVSPEDLALLPPDVRNDCDRELPVLVRGLSRYLKERGATIVSCTTVPGRELETIEGPLPKIAAKHGVALRSVNEYIVARK